jgi:choline-sulfatase/uncharacterized sulfatase
MNPRPNILFLMSDQHNAACAGFAGHPTVCTPNLDALARQGVRFNHAYCNNPICSPSRICFITGQYAHTHGFLGNNNTEWPHGNLDTLGAVFRRHGYQTAMIGKDHTIRRWDEEAYEHIRYVDLTDAHPSDPRTCHYFQYLVDQGVADLYEDGTLPPDHENNIKGCAIARLPYEHTNEHYTGEESLKFLQNRDRRRPFYLQMSFERPHPNWMPSPEHADLYSAADIQLGPDASDWWEHQWAGRPQFIRDQVAALMKGKSREDFKKMLAHQFALITVIDMEIGRVLDHLRQTGEIDNTIIIYTADHGDFAGDHGICNKNIGIYESIQRIPLLLRYPGGPQAEARDGIVESIDLFPTLCELADVPVPQTCEGRSFLSHALGKSRGKPQALCEWDFPQPQRFFNALRTDQYRLVYYDHDRGGELYDHQSDPHEMHNLWEDPDHQSIRLRLMEQLFDRVNRYRRNTDFDADRRQATANRLTPTFLIHKNCGKWSDIASAAALRG